MPFKHPPLIPLQSFNGYSICFNTFPESVGGFYSIVESPQMFFWHGVLSAFAIGSSTSTVFVSYEDSIKYNMSGENKSCP